MGNLFTRFSEKEEEKKQENREEEGETPRYLRLIWICLDSYLPRDRMVSTRRGEERDSRGQQVLSVPSVVA